MCLEVCFLPCGCLCAGVCGICQCTFGSFKQGVRFSYITLFLFFISLVLLINWISPFLSLFSWFGITCPNTNDLSCLGASVIYRASLVLVVFHALILFALLFRSKFSQTVNEMIWAVKLLFVIGLFIGSMWIPNSFFAVYSNIAMVFSIFFLIFQIIMMIDICYLWNESWVGQYDSGKSLYAPLLIGFTLLIYGGFIAFTVFQYNWFAGCGAGTAVITITVCLAVICSVLSVSGMNPNGSIFTSSTVSIYASYLIWLGLSNMSTSCNTTTTTDATTGETTTTSTNTNTTDVMVVYIITGGIITLVALLYMSFGDSEEASGNVKVGGNVDLAKAVLDTKKNDNHKYEEDIENDHPKKQEEIKSSKETVEAGKLSDYTRSNAYIYFHIIMIFASFYMSVLLTDWGKSDPAGSDYSFNPTSNLAAWLMIGSAWVTLVLYAWTIVAPRIFPDRQFGQLDNKYE